MMTFWAALGLLWAQVFPFPGPSAPASSPVTYIASNGQTLGVGSSTDTVTTTTTRTIAAGEHVVCTGTIRSGSTLSITSIDVGALSLSLDKGGDSDTFGTIAVYSARATAEIASGATISMVVGSATTLAKTVSCASLANVAASSYVRASATAAGTSAGPSSVATDSSPASGDLVWNGLIKRGSVVAVKDDDYTLHMTVQTEATNGSAHGSQYRELSAGGAQTATWTWASGSVEWRTVSVVYRP